MKKIVLTSQNPVKKSVAEEALTLIFPGESFDYMLLPLEKDGAEPVGKDAILAQMKDAMKKARAEVPNADYYVAMEGGVIIESELMHETAYSMVENFKGASTMSSCSSFPIPTQIAEEVKKGADFGDAVDRFFKTSGVKQGGGFVSVLTNRLINKKDHYLQPLIIAFSSLLHEDWYR